MTAPAISVANLSFRYADSERWILRDISFTVGYRENCIERGRVLGKSLARIEREKELLKLAAAVLPQGLDDDRLWLDHGVWGLVHPGGEAEQAHAAGDAAATTPVDKAAAALVQTALPTMPMSAPSW